MKDLMYLYDFLSFSCDYILHTYFIQSFNRYLLSCYYVSGVVNKMDTILDLVQVYTLLERQARSKHVEK